MSQTTSPQTKLPKTLQRKPVLIGAALVIAATLIVALSLSGGGRSEQVVYHTAKRGDFLVSIVEGGTLRALNDVKIRSEVEGTSRIINIVPEGTYVKKGDLLVELDSSEIRERLAQQEITYENNLASFIQAREALAIQRSQSESTVKEAELRLEFAKSALEKFEEAEIPLQRQNASNRITIIDEELQRAIDRRDGTEELNKNGYATLTELQADELAVRRKKIELQGAEEDLRLLIKYDEPNRLRQLRSDVEQAAMELDRAKHRATSQIAQAEADLRSRESTLSLAESRLAQFREQLEKSTIHAPQDGLVVYAMGSGGGMGGASTLIEEGAQIRQRQEIIQLPDISQMVLEIKVHESHVGQVRQGQAAFVTIDSMPERLFRGRVRRVSLLPDTQTRWGNPNLKIYTTEILIEDTLPEINPGVSARAEIVITNLKDVVTLPIQAVTTLGGRQVAYLAQGRSVDPVPVEVGLFNDRFIEVRSGVSEGDRVLLAPPIRRDSDDVLGSPLARRGAEADAIAASAPARPPQTNQVANPTIPVRAEEAVERSEPRPSRADFQRMREELDQLTPEEREARLREFRERRGPRPERPAVDPSH